MFSNDFNCDWAVFCQEHYNPLGMVRTLGEAGISPRVIVVRGSVPLVSRSKYCGDVAIVESIEDGYTELLRRARCDGRKTCVLTSDDTITSFLDRHYNEMKERFLFFNAGKPGRLSFYMDKERINLLAKKHGLNVLDSAVVETEERSNPLGYPVITKATDSLALGWKQAMHVCRNECDFLDALESIDSDRILVQRYIEKKNEYCVEGCSVDKGRKVVFTIASTYRYVLDDSYSPYMDVSNCVDLDIWDKLRAMIAEIGFEGIFECEFLVSQEGELFFCEINFRNSTWSYASTCAGMPLPLIWAKGMEDKAFNLNACITQVKDGFTAIVEPSDFKHRVLKGKRGIVGWIADLKRADCRYYLGRGDFKPVFSYLLSRRIDS